MKLLTNLLFEPKGKHDPTLAYSIKDTVMSADGSQVYFALQDVPAGIALDNEDYWKLQIDLHDTLVGMEEATAAAKAAATGAVSTAADQNLTETQKANARRNIGLDKVIESLSDPLEASGNPLVVKPVGGMPFESVVTEFSPQQEGSGDPHPAGGGRNLLETVAVSEERYGVMYTVNPDGSITANGTATANSVFYVHRNFQFKGGVEYTLSGCPAGGSTSTYMVYAQEGVTFDTGSGVTFAFDGDVSKNVMILVYAGVKVTNLVFKPMIRLASDSNATYDPWENIRPLSGWDKLDLNAAGKNLWPNGDVNGTRVASYEISVPAGNLVLSGVYQSSDTDSSQSRIVITATNGEEKLFYVNRGERFACATNFSAPIRAILFYESSSSAASDGDAFSVKDIQLELASAATYFVPYQGNDLHTLQIGQTVYGGRVDWTKGEMVAEWAMETLDGNTPTSSFAYATNGNVSRFGYLPFVDVGAANQLPVCSHFKGVLNAGGFTDVWTVKCNPAEARMFFMLPADIDTQEKFVQWLAVNPVQISYKLAKPITIQLPATEIIALPSTNTLYGDGDSITVTGRQPKTSALESRLAALEAAMTNV